MDVNQVKFGNYTVNNWGSGAKRKEEQKEESQAPQAKETTMQNVSAEEVFDVLDVKGMQNKSVISFVSKTEINPKDYLSDERIRNIEAMMAEFENGVNKSAEVIDKEFGGLLPADQKMALAAKVFAQE